MYLILQFSSATIKKRIPAEWNSYFCFKIELVRGETTARCPKNETATTDLGFDGSPRSRMGKSPTEDPGDS